jgi:hypothetical protein
MFWHCWQRCWLEAAAVLPLWRPTNQLGTAAFLSALHLAAAPHYNNFCRYITNVINLFLWAPCKAAEGFSTPWLVPDGWNLLHMESTPPQGPYKAPLPMYAVLKNGDGKQLAVIIRGTRTAGEWRVGECMRVCNSNTYVNNARAGA